MEKVPRPSGRGIGSRRVYVADEVWHDVIRLFEILLLCDVSILWLISGLSHFRGDHAGVWVRETAERLLACG